MNTVDDIRPLARRSFVTDGALVPIDAPCALARPLTIDGVAGGSERGVHLHIRCQQTINLRRRSEIGCDDGARRASFPLASPTHALVVPAAAPISQRFPVADRLLLVLADRPCEPEDRVRDRAALLAFRAAGGAR